MRTKPNFFLVGVPKAGTTALYHQLRHHPDIYMPEVKEPHYFMEWVRPGRGPITRAEYEALFIDAGSARAVGEATPDYFHWPDSPRRIAGYDPEARIVVSLRQPVQRSYSHYKMMRNDTRSSFRDFNKATQQAIIALKAGKVAPFGSGYRHSFYAEALKRWYDLFQKERVLVLIYEEYLADPETTLENLYAFLGVDPSFKPGNIRTIYNKGMGVPRIQPVQSLLYQNMVFKRWVRRLVPESLRARGKKAIETLNHRPEIPLSNEQVQRLTAHFMDDIRATERMLGRDLKLWYSL